MASARSAEPNRRRSTPTRSSAPKTPAFTAEPRPSRSRVVMSASTDGGGCLCPRDDGDDPTGEHRDDDVREVEDLVELRGREDHRSPLASRVADELVDVRPAADVDAAGRLVESEEYGALPVKRAAEQHLLLIAAAQAGLPESRADRDRRRPWWRAHARHAASRRRRITPSRLRRRSRATVRLLSTDCPRKRPSRWRSFGM